ncbi:diguanylate cyclase [Methylorubrum rhodesianum]|uniref:diguanylate cyclase n=1 Tax=Methylorubrum rhodesianum TaxID=29427 RepID=A0ABU9ZB22_9HYPH|nr:MULTISPECIES: diguanylate cyclase [Methylorubrum]MBB5763936.1 diguanylate cyclase (GGDEF)-like protein [Methylorubrum rhodesianum]MBI1690367.1 diguanylate cyclase [Methylorubrum sp. DB1722]MBK3401541.1 diguanylate cyclase [Methylorubrum rhodesianum]MBY0142002.1 diguanylate cyclase [Methylorubrum populi]
MLQPIEAGLSRPWYRLKLPEVLEAEYRAETARQDGLYVQSWLAVFTLFNILSLAMDHDVFGPERFIVPLAMTLGVFCPVALIAIASLRGRPTMVRISGAVLATALVDIVVVLNSARLAPASHTDVYIIIATIVPLVVGLIAPLPFRHCLWFCGCSFVLYVGLVLGLGLCTAERSGLPLLVSGLILVPLKLCYSREWAARNTFLIALRVKLQAEALARANARLTVLSETDSLTTLSNRRHFTERLEAAWDLAGEQDAWLGVILIDIDHFKLLNDTAGHAEGDLCLVAVAAAFQASVEAHGGLAARYGGEEFAALLPGAEPAAARLAGEAVRAAVADLAIRHPGLSAEVPVTVSVGVTAARGRTRDFGIQAADLLKAADFALYAAKNEGRNRVESFMPAANANRPAAGSGRIQAVVPSV